MSCCGQKRSQLSLSGRVAAGGKGGVAPTPSPVVLFEYTGKTGITIIGSGTGRTYRFSHPGTRVQIDIRDLSSLAAVPNLSRV